MAEQYREIQLAVEAMLNTNAIIRRKKKTAIEKKKEMFFVMINTLEEAIVRSNIASQELSIDLFKYEEKFMGVIDILLHMNFGFEAVDVITYYLYDRIGDDGSIMPLLSADNKEIILTTPYELWDLIVQINPKINE